MRKITKMFDDIWARADAHNKKTGFRFSKIFEVRDRYVTMGIYDTKTHRYCLFDTINFSGNYRYNPKEIPEELYEMEKLVQAA